MNYQKVPAEEEWDFDMFQPVGAEPHYQWMDAQGEYEPAGSNPFLDEVMLDVLPKVARIAVTLGIEAPYAAYSTDDQGWLARYVDGTRPPVFLVDPRPTERFRNPTRFIYDSLLHELGHVYLRSIGLPYEDEEEEVVEKFALAGGKASILHAYEKEWE